MTFPEFIGKNYQQEPGRAVSLKSIIREFYQSDALASFDYPPDKIRKYLESRFPVGNLYHETFVGNLTGADSRIVAERDLVVFGGDLLPRDLKPEEFELYKAHKSSATTLTRNEMRMRGWDRHALSRAQMLKQSH